MNVEIVNKVKPTLTASDHPYLGGAWTPQFEEVNGTDLTVIGEIPKDLSGVYIRNTENPVHDAIGTYHPFDGDGMLHALWLHEGQATYRNRFVQTRGFMEEQEAGRSLWTGIAGDPRKSERPGWGARGAMKDGASTDVVVHAGEVLATHYMCGEGYLLDAQTLDPRGTAPWSPTHGVSAHPKVDLETGELLFFNYGKEPPYMHYGVVGADRQLKHLIPVELPGPRLPHDMAFTRNYSILVDLPLFWNAQLLEAGYHLPMFHADLPTRFAIVPRYGSPEEIRWFEAAPTFVLHWTNAYEEGNEVVVEGYFQEEPDPQPLPGFEPKMGKLLAGVDEASFRPKLHRWRFNLSTGATREERLDDRNLEFGTINQHYAGRKARYLYSTTTEPNWFLFNGLVRHDLATGESQSLAFGENRYGSEAPFAPRIGAMREDDGYLLSFVTDLNRAGSECLILDAADISAGPVCRILLPHQISSGTHAVWAAREEFT
ncbi:MAG: carotenoid oxygenase family protein [Pseudomonadota bacterium]